MYNEEVPLENWNVGYTLTSSRVCRSRIYDMAAKYSTPARRYVKNLSCFFPNTRRITASGE